MSKQTDQALTVDIAIIGGGSGGLSVAAGAAQMGASTVLIEKAEMGGDCLNTGCIPSKAPDRRRPRRGDGARQRPFRSQRP